MTTKREDILRVAQQYGWMPSECRLPEGIKLTRKVNPDAIFGLGWTVLDVRFQNVAGDRIVQASVKPDGESRKTLVGGYNTIVTYLRKHGEKQR